MEVLGLEHVDFTVNDLGRSTAFYACVLEALGFNRFGVLGVLCRLFQRHRVQFTLPVDWVARTNAGSQGSVSAAQAIRAAARPFWGKIAGCAKSRP